MQIFQNHAGNNDWKNYWAKAFAFDALIGNTDRHQDNWGIIVNSNTNEIRICPVFDNGTSLGYEQKPEKFSLFEQDNHLKRYVSKGRHHIKWDQNDAKGTGHSELLQKLVQELPETQKVMVDSLKKVNSNSFEEILDYLKSFNVQVELTAKRAEFMLKLLKFRHTILLEALEG